MSYDAFATTFSNSRKNLYWPELDYIIRDMMQYTPYSMLDIGCGNGRFLTEITNYELRITNYLGIDSSEGMIMEARKLHPDHHFDICSMLALQTLQHSNTPTFDSLLFLASFHHLESRTERIQVLQDISKLLAPNGRIYMTNWNLRDQTKYETSHRWDGDYDIKIGAYSRYYHGFTLDELSGLFEETGYQIIENRVSEGGRNFLSILSL